MHFLFTGRNGVLVRHLDPLVADYKVDVFLVTRTSAHNIVGLHVMRHLS